MSSGLIHPDVQLQSEVYINTHEFHGWIGLSVISFKVHFLRVNKLNTSSFNLFFKCILCFLKSTQDQNHAYTRIDC